MYQHWELHPVKIFLALQKSIYSLKKQKYHHWSYSVSFSHYKVVITWKLFKLLKYKFFSFIPVHLTGNKPYANKTIRKVLLEDTFSHNLSWTLITNSSGMENLSCPHEIKTDKSHHLLLQLSGPKPNRKHFPMDTERKLALPQGIFQ